MILKSKFLQFCSIICITYSMLGGLILPLSPNIESLTYIATDTTIVFKLKTPKINPQNNHFYLIKNALDSVHRTSYAPIKVIQEFQGYQVTFPNPSHFTNINKGQSFDIMCTNPSDGDMYYFEAFYVDSVIPTYPSSQVPILHNPTPSKLSFPNRTILRESIRNLFFHVPMWFTMMALLIYSLVQSIYFLAKDDLSYDTKASQAVYIALLFGSIGIVTGMIWAKYTWGAFWTNDPKLNGAAIGMLAYCAYWILRSSIDDSIKRAKLSAVYNIFAFTIYFVFIMILPRVNDSLHPGNGGNPGFNIYEQDNIMRLFFYPAVIGWILLGFWLVNIKVAICSIDSK